ncbi:hypothetical protein [Plantactinospora sonchi]|uniref:Uncharacterized protein n=1 Tax=Plantactinospora sonchi TaxID=1544735 RepID=A0ABU7S0E0_9ACTN
MLSLARRAADKAIGLFLPEAEANADYWGRYCYCFNNYRYYELWTWVNGAPVNQGCQARYAGC